MKTFITIAAAALATALTTGFATAAFAEPRIEASTTVSYAGLDLASPAGQAQLARRIHSAAYRVCSVSNGSSLADKVDEMHCRAKAIADAQVHVAALTPPVFASR